MSEQTIRIVSLLLGAIGFGTFSYIGFFKPEIFDIPTKGGVWTKFIADTPEKRAKRIKSYRRTAWTNLCFALLATLFLLREVWLILMY